MIGGLILVCMYVLIIFEVTHKTVATMLASAAAIAVLALLDERPTLEEILTWIDIETEVKWEWE